METSNIIYDLNNQSNILDIKDVKDRYYYITFNVVPQNFTINVINSNVVIIENYQNDNIKTNITINIDSNSHLERFSIIKDCKSNQEIDRNVNNSGYYKSMQLDLTTFTTTSNENINLVSENANSEVIVGILANGNTTKKYQTNLNHNASNTTANAKLFAINNDTSKVTIYTDGYIKNKASKVKTSQEGRIINLSSTCSSIVLPNLHIDENDVEASHSCSVGSINQEHLYYLTSRGLSEKQAKDLLVYGYFTPLLNEIKDNKIKETLDLAITKRIF